MQFKMNHLNELACLSYAAQFSGSRIDLLFTQAYFADCYKGFSKSRPCPENAQHPSVEKKSPVKHSKRYYSSLTYVLHRLKNGDDSSSSSSSSDEGDTLTERRIHRMSVKSSWVQSSEIASPPSHSTRESTETDYYETVLEQMRALGLPTSFGGRGHSGCCKKARPPRKYSSSDVDNLLLVSDDWNNNIWSRSRSLTNLSKATTPPTNTHSFDDGHFNSATRSLIDALCRVLKLSSCHFQPHVEIPDAVCLRIPDSWRRAKPCILRKKIRSTLSGKGCRAFRYKPLAARSSRRFLDKHSEPPESLLLPGEKEMPPHVLKYWSQRYRLFSRFDEGVQINREGLFSVTPEVIAVHHASRFRRLLEGQPSSHTLLDLFSGVGGNAIQLALVGFNVISVDLNPDMLRMAEANARVYGVQDKMSFIHADAFQFLTSTTHRFSGVLISPPWGGPSYISRSTFNLLDFTFAGEEGTSERRTIFNLVPAVSRVVINNGPIALFLPKQSNVFQVLGLRFTGYSLIECELALIHHKPKGLTVYLMATEEKSDSSGVVQAETDEPAENEDIEEEEDNNAY